MAIKLIATDMDDTLLNSKIEVSEGNAKALKAAKDAGLVVMIATGRMFCSAQAYAKKLGLDVPMVTYNGGLVKGSLTEEVFYEQKLNVETAREILQYCKEKGYYVQAYEDDQLVVEKETDFTERYKRIANVEAKVVGEELYNIKTAPNKLLLMTTSEDFQKAWDEIAEKFKGRADVTSSKTNFLEIMEHGVNKWNAVKAVGEMYNIKPEEIMCIGDSNNDLPMIKNAGIGVAVANANEEVRKAAKIVTADHDKDGVALVINSILTEQIEVPEV